MATSERPSAGVDFDRPSIARVFDALMGGQDNYAADRAVLRQILEIAPESQTVAQEVRQWLVRAVRYLTERLGVDQFLDLGSGFPTVENTHQVAQRYNPEAHVVYVDNDPVVQAHSRAVLLDNDFTHISGADLLRVEETLSDVERYLDFDRPVGLVMCSIIHHITDLQQAQQVVKSYVGAMAPGSYLVLLHQHNPDDGSEAAAVATSLQDRFSRTGLDTAYRTRAEIASFFDGVDLLEPGLTAPHQWWPDGPRLAPLTPANWTSLCGVARIP
ncbi:SAM-dependent methyltransferase [Amycolatopsis nalaikhensis]|uniref:SAM-dependent methyltransferase n=1 Tax=Amycolatopsis nalaikhensis TaxID=715472 RepID=A0ABY8XWU1_9PSEU|nr:SAM-dependent methyltransferase [Amycolatopsis sp. 2-2]WIV59860.1 SAM-dependent methyltransferase [Amycolatopsis sp. 2-2]